MGGLSQIPIGMSQFKREVKKYPLTTKPRRWRENPIKLSERRGLAKDPYGKKMASDGGNGLVLSQSWARAKPQGERNWRALEKVRNNEFGYARCLKGLNERTPESMGSENSIDHSRRFAGGHDLFQDAARVDRERCST